MSPQLFCDTSFFFAALMTADPNHTKAKNVLLENPQAQLVTTWDIVSETVTLLRYRSDYVTAVQFLDKVQPKLELISCDASLRDEAMRVFKKFAKDKRLSFCDCFSFVVLEVLLQDVPVLTFDRDFKQFGFEVLC